MRTIVLAILAASLFSGCATTERAIEPQQEKEFVTGSNIPRRDRSGSGVAVYDREALEKAQNSGGGPTQRGQEVPRN